MVVLQSMCLSRISQISRVSSTVDNPRYRSVYPGKGVFELYGTIVTSSKV